MESIADISIFGDHCTCVLSVLWLEWLADQYKVNISNYYYYYCYQYHYYQLRLVNILVDGTQLIYLWLQLCYDSIIIVKVVNCVFWIESDLAYFLYYI